MKTVSIFSGKLFFVFFISIRLSAQTVSYPISNFSASATFICAGDAVQFTDLSSNNPGTWNWTFHNGNPATSTLQNPVVVFNSPGKYDVILTASNAQGSQSKGLLNMITVMECTDIKEYLEDSDLHIFPNPTQSYVNVVTSIDAPFILLNAIGSVILRGDIKKGEVTTVDLENLPSGIYFLSLREGYGTKHIKIVKE